MKSSRAFRDITDMLKGRNVPPEAYAHITVNTELSRINGAQYDIVRGSTHDGSGNFTEEIFREVVTPLLNKQTYFFSIDKMPIRYEVGLLRWASVYGSVELHGETMFGQRERMRLPVRCIYEEG